MIVIYFGNVPTEILHERHQLYLRLIDKQGRQEKNGGVKGRDRRAEELDRETGEEQITVGRTRRKDGG